jgi:hypothetical protein
MDADFYNAAAIVIFIIALWAGAMSIIHALGQD